MIDATTWLKDHQRPFNNDGTQVVVLKAAVDTVLAELTALRSKAEALAKAVEGAKNVCFRCKETKWRSVRDYAEHPFNCPLSVVERKALAALAEFRKEG